MPSISKHTIICPVCCPGSHGCYRYIVYNEHDHSKNRQCCETVCYYFINFIRNRQFVLGCFCAARVNDRCNVCITLVSNNALGIIIKFFFQCCDLIGYIRHALHLICDLIVPLQKFDREKSLLLFCHITSQTFFHTLDVLFNFFIKLVNDCVLSLLRCCDGFGRYFFKTFTFQCRNLNYFTAEFFTQRVNVDLVAIFSYNIHHVDSHNNRNA